LEPVQRALFSTNTTPGSNARIAVLERRSVVFPTVHTPYDYD
jgi:hypothetical protein